MAIYGSVTVREDTAAAIKATWLIAPQRVNIPIFDSGCGGSMRWLVATLDDQSAGKEVKMTRLPEKKRFIKRATEVRVCDNDLEV